MGSLFGVPSMLWWGAAASIPVLIHLLSRRKFRRVPWAAMQFLELAFKRTRRRLRLENLLLMLMRAAVLLLFAIALAEPRTSAGGLLGGGDARTAFIVIDDSFSMALRDDRDRTAFARAIERVGALLDGFDVQTDAAALLTSGGTARIRVPLTRDVGRVRDALEALSVGNGVTDTIGALRVVDGLLSEPELEREFPGRKTVYLFTDLQRSALMRDVATPDDPESDGVATPDPNLERLLRDVRDADADVVFVDVGVVDTENVANVCVTSLEHVGKSLVSGMTLDFEAVVENFGDETVSGELQFFVDSEEAFVQRELVTDLKGRATGAAEAARRSIRFSARFAVPGWHHVAVRYVDDALGVDNVRRFAFEVRDRMRVLAVDGSGARDEIDAATFFVSRALDPWQGRAEGGSSSFTVDEVSLLDFRTQKLEGFDLIVLANVAQLPPARVADLERFVRDGGSLLYFAGLNLDVPGRIGPGGSTNAALFRDGEGLLPLKMLRTRGSDDLTTNPYNLQFETFAHPAMRYFEDPKIRPGVTRMPVYKFVETEPREADGVEVLATFRPLGAEGDTAVAWPALIERRFGEGRVVFFTSSADKSWNLYGATPAFVPMIRELAFYLTRRTARDNYLVGEKPSVRLPSTVGEVTITVGDDAPINRKTAREEGSPTARVALSRLEKAALVRITPVGENATGTISARLLAINVDPAESDLTRGGRGWMTANFGTELVRVVDGEDEVAIEATAEAGSDAWRKFLYAVLILLLVETMLARLFGRESVTTAPSAAGEA